MRVLEQRVRQTPKAHEIQNIIAKFKTTSLGQDKNSNFAPAQTQIPGLALLLLYYPFWVLLPLPRDPDEDPNHKDGQEEAPAHGNSDQTGDGLLRLLIVKED